MNIEVLLGKYVQVAMNIDVLLDKLLAPLSFIKNVQQARGITKYKDQTFKTLVTTWIQLIMQEADITASTIAYRIIVDEVMCESISENDRIEHDIRVDPYTLLRDVTECIFNRISRKSSTKDSIDENKCVYKTGDPVDVLQTSGCWKMATIHQVTESGIWIRNDNREDDFISEELCSRRIALPMTQISPIGSVRFLNCVRSNTSPFLETYHSETPILDSDHTQAIIWRESLAYGDLVRVWKNNKWTVAIVTSVKDDAEWCEFRDTFADTISYEYHNHTWKWELTRDKFDRIIKNSIQDTKLEEVVVDEKNEKGNKDVSSLDYLFTIANAFYNPKPPPESVTVVYQDESVETISWNEFRITQPRIHEMFSNGSTSTQNVNGMHKIIKMSWKREIHRHAPELLLDIVSVICDYLFATISIGDDIRIHSDKGIEYVTIIGFDRIGQYFCVQRYNSRVLFVPNNQISCCFGTMEK